MPTFSRTAPLITEDQFRTSNVAQSPQELTRVNLADSDLANLDLLRSVAVGIVFFTHTMDAMRIRGFGDLGRFGVLLFFVHTSLVLMLSMERLRLTGTRLYTAFMIRRIFRIYPLSVVTIIVVVCFHIPFAPWFAGVSGGFNWPGWPGLFSNFLLTQNITRSPSVLCVLWSLPFEVQMYAWLPLLYIFIRRFPSLRAISLIWFVSIAIASMEYIVRVNIDPDSLLLRFFPCFFAGVAAWRLMETRKRRIPAALWAALLMALVMLYRLEDALRVYGPNWQGLLHGTLRNDHRIWLPSSLDLIRDWVFCGIVGVAVPFFKEIRSLWLNSVTKRVAQYSYGVYVCHVPVIWVCFSLLHFGNVFARAILTVFLTALLSFTLYYLIEHPAIQLGKHLTARRANRIAIT